jgi:uncharacterized protein YuzE
MKLNYFPDTDSLYIDLAQRPSVESREVSEGVVLDYDGDGSSACAKVLPHCDLEESSAGCKE